MTEYTGYIMGWGGIPGGWEWIVILIVALLIFGKRLPDVARSIGKSLTSFKKGLNEGKDIKDELADDIKDIKDDVINEVKEATNLNDSDKKD